MMLDIGWPQVVYLVLAISGLVVQVLTNHGSTPKIIGNFTGFFLVIGILYWGGFFS
jgi:hypothetical protein